MATKKQPTKKKPGNSTKTNTADTTKDTQVAATDEEILARVKSLIEAGQGFGQSLADKYYSDGSLGRVSETLSPDEAASIDQLKNFAASIGIQPEQVAKLIAQQQGILDTAQQYTSPEQEALDVNRRALAGLSAPEYEALRSQGNDQINGAVQQAARQLAKAQAGGQVFGSAATAQMADLGRSRVRESRNLERDLIVKDVDVKRIARQDFTNAVNQVESARAGRTNAASNALSGTIAADQSTRTQGQNQANANLASATATAGDNLRKLREYNLNQAAAEKAGQIGAVLGGTGAYLDLRGLLAGEDFANKQYFESKDVQDKIFEIVQKALKSGSSTLGV